MSLELINLNKLNKFLTELKKWLPLHYADKDATETALDTKANKSEMEVTAVSGDSTKKTIKLKDGLSQDVVVDISDKQDALPQSTANQYLQTDSSNNITWGDIPRELPISTASDEDKLLRVNSSGSPVWAQLSKSPWGTVITDSENNPMLDENGNSIYDENEVELWTSFNGVNFGAERAVADIEGNSLNLTVAGGMVSAIGGKPLTAETALTDVNGDSLVNTYAKKTDIIPPLADGGLLNDGTTITVPNNARSFVSTSKSAIILEVNLETGEVPNFALEIHSNQQTGIKVRAVSPESVSVLKYSNAGGNIIEANKDYQLTCVGTCWTLAEFKRPSDATYDFGALNITFTDDVGSASVDNEGNYIRITEPVLVESLQFDREFTIGKPATLVLPFKLDDASKLTSGKLYEIADIVYDENKRDKYGAILSSDPVLSIEANHPYVYIPEAVSFNITLGTGEQLLLVPTVDPTIRLEATSGLWLIHGTYTSTIIGNLPGFDPDDNRFYGYVGESIGQYQVGDFAKVSANASLYLMRVCFERTFPLPSE